MAEISRNGGIYGYLPGRYEERMGKWNYHDLTMGRERKAYTGFVGKKKHFENCHNYYCL